MGVQTGYLSGATLGRFRIGPLIGRGGVGEVYRGDDQDLMILRFAVSRDGQLALARGTQTGDAVLITNFR
jgi:hypothetical protein